MIYCGGNWKCGTLTGIGVTVCGHMSAGKILGIPSNEKPATITDLILLESRQMVKLEMCQQFKVRSWQ